MTCSWEDLPPRLSFYWAPAMAASPQQMSPPDRGSAQQLKGSGIATAFPLTTTTQGVSNGFPDLIIDTGASEHERYLQTQEQHQHERLPDVATGGAASVADAELPGPPGAA